MPKDYFKESGARRGLGGALKDLADAARGLHPAIDPEKRLARNRIESRESDDPRTRQTTDRHNSY